MGFLDMFDHPDIMGRLFGLNLSAPAAGSQSLSGADAAAIAPGPSGPPPPMGGMMGEVFDTRGGGPRIGNTPAITGPDGTPMMPPPSGPQVGPSGQTIPDRAGPTWTGTLPPGAPTPGVPALAPGQPAGPTMAGVGFPPPPPGSAMAMPAAPGTATTMPGGSDAAWGGPPPIPTAAGPARPPGGPLDGRPAMPPPPGAYAGGPPTSTYGDIAASLGLNDNRSSLGNAITAGMAGLGRGLTQVGQLHPGAPRGQAFAAGAGGALEGGVHQLDLQQHQAHQQKMDNWLMTSGAFKDWVAARHADNEERSTDARALYYKSLANGTAGGGRGALRTPEQKVAFVENETLRMRDQFRKSAEKTAAALGKEVDEALIDKRAEEYRRSRYKIFNIDPDEAEKIGMRGVDETNPFPKGMTTEEFHERVPMGAFYDTGQKFDKDGNYKYTRSDGSVGVHRGSPGARVILQRTAPPPELNGGVTPPSKLPLAEQESLLADEGQAPA